MALKHFPHYVLSQQDHCFEFLSSGTLSLLEQRGETVLYEGNIILPNEKGERKHELLKWEVMSQAYTIFDCWDFLFSETFDKKVLLMTCMWVLSHSCQLHGQSWKKAFVFTIVPHQEHTYNQLWRFNRYTVNNYNAVTWSLLIVTNIIKIWPCLTFMYLNEWFKR